MPSGDVAQPVSWKVIGVNPTVDVTAGSTPVAGNTITYQTGLGHRGSVFVPNSASVPDGVKVLVREAATRTDALATMSE